MDRSEDADSSCGDGATPPPPHESDPRGRHRGARRDRSVGFRLGSLTGRSRRAHLLVRIISAALSACLLAYIGYLWSSVHNIDNKVPHVRIAAIDNPRNSSGHTLQDIDGKDQNLLIVGNDDRTGLSTAEINMLKTGGGDGSLSTDTMMIVHIPADGSRATLISLPRDSYVAIPGHGMDKLNAAYAFGYRNSTGNRDTKIAAGGNLLIQTVTNLTGLHIDHFVQVGLIGFYRISNAVGGVQVNLCNAVDDTGAHNRAIGSDGGSGLVLSKGIHTIQGVQALEFVRQRHGLTNGDLDRVQRQRYFLTAAFRRVASAGILLNPSRLGNLVNAIDDSLYVDKGLKILDLAKQLANLSANNIVGKTIPIVRDDPNTSAGDALIVGPAQVQAFVRSMIGTDTTAYQHAKAADPSTVTVRVLNEGQVAGAAETAAKALKKAGFPASVGTTAAQSPTTTVLYPRGQEAQAKTLVKYVPGATVQQSDVATVTLVLGGDHRTARAAPQPLTPTSKSSASTGKTPTAIDAHCIN